MRKKQNPYLSLKIGEEMMKNIVDLWVKYDESVRETNEEDNEQSLKRKTRDFHDWTKSLTSRQDKPQDNWDEVFEKFV